MRNRTIKLNYFAKMRIKDNRICDKKQRQYHREIFRDTPYPHKKRLILWGVPVLTRYIYVFKSNYFYLAENIKYFNQKRK